MSIPVYPPINTVVSKTEYAVDNGILEDRITNIEGMTLSNSAAISNLNPYLTPMTVKTSDSNAAFIQFQRQSNAVVPFATFGTSNINLSNIANINGSAYPPSSGGGSSMVGLNAFSSPINFVMTASDFGKTYVCLPNNNIDIRLPNPSLLPNTSVVTFINCGTGYAATLMILFYTSSGTTGVGLSAGSSITLIAQNGRYDFARSANGTGGSLNWS